MGQKALQKTFATSHGIKSFALFRQIDGILHKVANFVKLTEKIRKRSWFDENVSKLKSSVVNFTEKKLQSFLSHRKLQRFFAKVL